VLWIELNEKIDAFELYEQALTYNISIRRGKYLVRTVALQISSGSALGCLMMMR